MKKIVNRVIVDCTAEEIAGLEQNRIAAANAANDEAASLVRAERNTKLADTDWMANSDVTMSNAWRTYRSALRDVPSQAGFPNSVTWPTEPS